MVEGLTLVQGEVNVQGETYSTYIPPFADQIAAFGMLKGGEVLVAKEFDFPELPR